MNLSRRWKNHPPWKVVKKLRDLQEDGSDVHQYNVVEWWEVPCRDNEDCKRHWHCPFQHGDNNTLALQTPPGVGFHTHAQAKEYAESQMSRFRTPVREVPSSESSLDVSEFVFVCGARSHPISMAILEGDVLRRNKAIITNSTAEVQSEPPSARERYAKEHADKLRAMRKTGCQTDWDALRRIRMHV